MAPPTPANLYLNQRMAALLAIGFASGLPLMLTGRTLKVWARDVGVDLTTIGLFSLITLPYTFKFIWAPVIDAVRLPWLGRRRGWLLLVQILLLASIGLMAWSGPTSAASPLHLFVAAALATTFFSATHDIVADAYRTDILTLPELGAGASVYSAGYRLAMLATGAGAVWVADSAPWATAYAIAALCVLPGMIATIMAPEPPGKSVIDDHERIPANFNALERGLFAAVISLWEPFSHFFKGRPLRAALVLLFIFAFKLPDYMAMGMTDPMLLDLGFSKEQIAFWGLGVGTAVTIPGVLVGGIIVARLGIRTSLLIFGLAQIASNAGYMVLAQAGPQQSVMITVIGIEYFCAGLVAAGFVAFLMSQCDRDFSATQFALLSGLMGLSNSLAGAPTGAIVEQVGYSQFFLITILVGLPGLALLPWMSISEFRKSEVVGSVDKTPN